MPSPRRTRFAALLVAAAVSGGALGACGRENETQGNNGGTAGSESLQTNPSTVAGQGTQEKTVKQQQHSVTSTSPSGTVTQPSQTLGQTNSEGG
jgi:hypothetical protein